MHDTSWIPQDVAPRSSDPNSHGIPTHDNREEHGDPAQIVEALENWEAEPRSLVRRAEEGTSQHHGLVARCLAYRRSAGSWK
eukprot:6490761-Amphidinium_carterae.4